MEYCLIKHLYRQREHSLKTFGPGYRKAGIIDHIKKELIEIETTDEENEWIDVILLALDGAYRSGYTPEEVVTMLEAKMTKNEGRNWPDWRTADPDKAIEHVKDN